jgi:hypothetical protein
MTVINLTALKDANGGRTALTAMVSAVVYKGLDKAIRRADSSLIFPAPVTVFIQNGAPLKPFELPTIPIDCYWRITVTAEDLPTHVLNAIVPQGKPTIDYDELIEIDPEAEFPQAGTPIGDTLIGTLEQIMQRVRDAEASALAARNAAIAAAAASKGLIPVPNDPGYYKFAV